MPRRVKAKQDPGSHIVKAIAPDYDGPDIIHRCIWLEVHALLTIFDQTILYHIRPESMVVVDESLR